MLCICKLGNENTNKNQNVGGGGAVHDSNT